MKTQITLLMLVYLASALSLLLLVSWAYISFQKQPEAAGLPATALYNEASAAVGSLSALVR